MLTAKRKNELKKTKQQVDMIKKELNKEIYEKCKNKVNSTSEELFGLFKKEDAKQKTKLLIQVKKEIIKYLNRSGYNEAYAKSIVELVFSKKIKEIGG